MRNDEIIGFHWNSYSNLIPKRGSVDAFIRDVAELIRGLKGTNDRDHYLLLPRELSIVRSLRLRARSFVVHSCYLYDWSLCVRLLSSKSRWLIKIHFKMVALLDWQPFIISLILSPAPLWSLVNLIPIPQLIQPRKLLSSARTLSQSACQIVQCAILRLSVWLITFCLPV